MSMISQYTFQRNFNNKTQLTKSEAIQAGVGSTNFTTADTNGDRKLSIEEILANQNICDTLMVQINNAEKTLKAESAQIKGEIETEKGKNHKNTEKSEKGEKPDRFVDMFGDESDSKPDIKGGASPKGMGHGGRAGGHSFSFAA